MRVALTPAVVDIMEVGVLSPEVGAAISDLRGSNHQRRGMDTANSSSTTAKHRHHRKSLAEDNNNNSSNIRPGLNRRYLPPGQRKNGLSEVSPLPTHTYA